MLNRLGYLSIAAILTTTTMTVGPVVFLSQQDLAETYIVMCVPVFVAVPDRALGRGGGGRRSGAWHPGLGRRLHTYVSSLFRDRKRDRILPGQYRRQRLSGESLPGAPRFLDRPAQSLAVHEPARGSRRALIEAKRQLWSVSIDLDNFKVINDSLGHTAGDELLVVIARRSLSCLRPADTPARLSGDKFAVVLDGIADIDD